jgi:hypothetical protein
VAKVAILNVVNTWWPADDKVSFCQYLVDIWEDRDAFGAAEDDWRYNPIHYLTLYQTGDYAIAAAWVKNYPFPVEFPP